MERGRVRDARGPDRRRRRPEGWRTLVGPCLLITAMGAVAIVFLLCCARKTQLDSQLKQTVQRVQLLRTYQQGWNAAIGQERDPAKLRSWAGGQGMVFTPAHVDHVRLSQSLPSPTAAASPLAALEPPPTKVARAPDNALARAPVGSSQD